MGLIIAAVIATCLALLTIGSVAVRAAPPDQRRMLLLAFLLSLPLQPLVFYAVRLPLDAVVRSFLGLSAAWGMVALLYAPLTEEPAKWLPLCVPPIRRNLSPATAVPLAFSIGLGFGIGEIWFLAHALVASPNYPDLPFWKFSGFILERLEVCFLHGVLVAAPIVRLARGRTFWPGALLGMALHLATNFPIYPAQLGAFGLNGAVWSLLIMGWVATLVLVGAFALCYLHHWLLRSVTPAPQ
ncbi:MAG: hypothetical protein ACJ8F3_13715 [Xanthobacteraceae bacterium]